MNRLFSATTVAMMFIAVAQADAQDPKVPAEEKEAVAALSKLGAQLETDDAGYVKTVILAEVILTDDDLENLGRLRKLDKLDLSRTAAGDKAMAAVAKCSNLRWLELSQTRVTDAGLEKLKGLENIEYLEMPGSTTNKGIANISEFKLLKTLYTGSTYVSDDGLAQLKNLHHLHTLFVSHTLVTDAGLNHLIGLRSLRRLYVVSTQVTKEGVKQFSRKSPKVRVRY